MKAYLIYSLENEPVTDILLKNRDVLPLAFISLKDLLDRGEIFDVFNSRETNIHWKIPGGMSLTNSPDNWIINRATQIPEKWFSDFDARDANYARNEYWSYLFFSLNSFPSITERPCEGSLHGNSLTLSGMWERVRQMNINVSIPEYYFGSFEYLPVAWKGNTIFTDPYSYYFWKAGDCPEDQKESVFALRKPSGIPVVVLVVGDQVHVYTEKIKENIEVESIKEKACAIHREFGFFCSEFLFFVGENSVTLGMISNNPWASHYSQIFEKLLLEHVDQCLSVGA